MEKFFVDIFDGKVAIDEIGYELPSQSAAKDLVNQILSDLMSREKTDHIGTRLRTDVRNEEGALIMTARLVMTIDEFRV